MSMFVTLHGSETRPLSKSLRARLDGFNSGAPRTVEQANQGTPGTSGTSDICFVVWTSSTSRPSYKVLLDGSNRWIQQNVGVDPVAARPSLRIVLRGNL